MVTTLWNSKSVDPLNDDSIPKMADGGIVNKATNAVVGEAGPEAIIPIDKLLSAIGDGSKVIVNSIKDSIANSIAEGIQSVSKDSSIATSLMTATMKQAMKDLGQKALDSASMMAALMKESMKETMGDLGQKVVDSAKNLKDNIVKADEAIKNKFSEVVTTGSAILKDTIINTSNTVKEKLSNISETVAETLELNKESNVMQQESLSIEIARETDRLYEKIKNAGNKVKKVGKNIFDTILHNPMISSLAVCLGILAKFPAIAEWVFSSPSTFLKAVQMWHKIKTLMTSLFKTLLKDPSKVFGAIKKGLNLYVKGLQKITKGLMKLPGILAGGYSKLLKGIQSLPGKIKILFDSRSKIMKELVDSVKGGLTRALETVKKIWRGGFGKFFKDLAKMTKDVGLKVAKSFKSMSVNFGRFMVDLGKDFAKITSQAMQKGKILFSGLKDLFKKVPNLLIGWQKYLKNAPSLGHKIVSGLATINVGFRHMVSGIKNIAKSTQVATDATKKLGALPKIGNMLKHPINTIKDVSKFAPKIINAIKHPISAITGIANFVGKTFKNLGSIAKGSKAVDSIAKLGAGAGAKMGAKGAFKKIPGIGSIISILFAINRFRKGQWFTGTLEFGSAIASMIPGIGTGISLAIDAITMMSDMVRDADVSTPEKVAEIKAGAGKGWLRNLPGIGTIVGIYDALRLFKAKQWGSGFYQAGRAIATIVPAGGYIFDGISSLVQMITEAGLGTKTDKGESQFGVGGAIIRQIPIIGSVFSIMSAIKRFKNGEIFTGILETASGISSLFPGLGTVVSSVLTGLTFFIDRVANEGDILTSAEVQKQNQSIKDGMNKGWLRNLPIIGSVMNLWDAFRLFKNGEILSGLRGVTRAVVGIVPGGGLLFDTMEGIVNWVVGNPPTEEQKQESQQIMQNMGSGWLRNMPVIGSVMNLWDSIKLFKNGEVLGGLKGVGRAVAGIVPGGGWLFDKVAGFAEWFFGSDATEGGENGLGLMGKEPTELTFLDRVKLMWDGGRKISSSQDAEAAMGVKMWKQAGLPDWMGRWMWRITHPIAAITSGFSGIEKLANQDTTELKDAVTESARKVKEGKDLLWSGKETDQIQGISKLKEAGWSEWQVSTLWTMYHPIDAIFGRWNSRNSKATVYSSMSGQDKNKYLDSITQQAEMVKQGKDLLWDGDENKQGLGIAKLRKAGWADWKIKTLWALYHPLAAITGGWGDAAEKAPNLNNMSNEDVSKYEDAIAKKAEVINKGMALLKSKNDSDQSRGIYMLQKQGYSKEQVEGMWKWYHPVDYVWGKIKGWFGKVSKFDTLWNNSFNETVKHYNKETAKAIAEDRADKLQMIATESAKIQASRFAEIDVKNKNLQDRLKDVSKAKIWIQSNNINDQAKAVGMLRRAKWSFNDIKQLWLSYHPELDAMGEITPSGLKRWDDVYKLSDVHAQNKKKRKKNVIEAIYKAKNQMIIFKRFMKILIQMQLLLLNLRACC